MKTFLITFVCVLGTFALAQQARTYLDTAVTVRGTNFGRCASSPDAGEMDWIEVSACGDVTESNGGEPLRNKCHSSCLPANAKRVDCLDMGAKVIRKGERLVEDAGL